MSNAVYDRPIDVVNWLVRMSDKLEFLENVSVIPFADMAIIHPKDMPKDKVISMLKQYWNIHSEISSQSSSEVMG